MMRPDFLRFLRSPLLCIPVIVAALLPYGLSSYHLAIGTLALLYVSLALSWNRGVRIPATTANCRAR